MDSGSGFRKLTLGALAVSFLFAGGNVIGQQVAGTLGQADATTTVNGKQLPRPASARAVTAC